MPEGGARPVMFNGVGSGVETPNAPDRAANDDMTLRIAAPHSLQADRGESLMDWRYSFRREQGGCRKHRSARYS